MPAGELRLEREGGVVHAQLHRPDKRNALDLGLIEAILAAGEELAADRSVRAVVLSGAGLAFSAGMDRELLAALARDPASGDAFFAPWRGGPANRAQQVAWTWKAMPVPVVAAIHGVCLGAGLQIALAADVRIARPDAELSIMETRWGLVPDMTGTQTLRDLVRLDVAKELTYTGRILSGTEAAALGLVTRCADDPLAEALALAREIAGRSPDAVRAAKRLLDGAARLDTRGGFELEAREQRALIGEPNQIETIAAALEKRAPVYRDPG